MGWTREIQELLSMLVVTCSHTWYHQFQCSLLLYFSLVTEIYKEHRNYIVCTYKKPAIFIDYLETAFLRVPGHWRHPNRIFVSASSSPAKGYTQPPMSNILYTIFYLEPQQHPLWHTLPSLLLGHGFSFSGNIPGPVLYETCCLSHIMTTGKGTFGQYRPTLVQ